MVFVDSKRPGPSVSERRGRRLAPLQTNFSRPTSQINPTALPRPHRPRPSDYDDNSRGERVPLQPAHVKRQTSKSSLRYLFSRDKNTRKSIDSKLEGIEEAQNPVKPDKVLAETPLSPSVCATPRTTTSTPTLVASPMDSRLPKSRTKHRQQPSEDKGTVEDTAWKPPPLFQAYPQAIKHISLQAPAISADSIVRLHATFKAAGNAVQDEDPQNRQPSTEDAADDLTARRKKVEKERKKHFRVLSDSIEKSQWAEKVYVLATSGYILQYGGGGKHDRLPERMLLLGPKSVAFASDAIPGKHWVLQISQTSEEDSTTRLEASRPLLSRFGFHRSHARRIARNFLLVFNSPEDLSSWLLAVRAQIEARGGKKYVSERVFDEGMEHQLRSPASIRQLVKKDPNRFSTVLLQPQQPEGSDDKESSVDGQSCRNSYISLHRRSMVMHPIPDARSESVSTVQTEFMSMSPVGDPSRFYSALGSPPPPESVVSDTTSLNGPTSPASSNPKKRRSLYLPQITSAEIAQIPRAQSTAPEAIPRSISPPAPNFSVPSFSQRFAARHDIPQVPRLPSAVSDPADDASTDTMSVFSSPPQSPERDIRNIPRGEMAREQRRAPSRAELPKKQIRTSNSEDSLGATTRDQDRSRLRYSLMPSTCNLKGPSIPPKLMRPTRVNGMARETPTEQQQSETEDKLNRLRNSVLYTDTSCRSTAAMTARRKSLNGLSIGPPVAPPPNCPLPKIPASFVKPSTPSIRSQESAPVSPIEERRSLATSPPPSSNTRLPQTARSLPSRHSRVAQGV